MYQKLEKKSTCCCGTAVCTQVIAWIDIICSASGFIATVVSLSKYIARAEAIEKQNREDNTDPDESNKEAFLMATTVWTLVGTVVSFIMGIVLLVGSLKKNPRLIQAWLITTTIGLIIQVLLVIGEGIVGGGFIPIVTMVIVSPFVVYFLLTVNNHRIEIMAVAVD